MVRQEYRNDRLPRGLGDFAYHDIRAAENGELAASRWSALDVTNRIVASSYSQNGPFASSYENPFLAHTPTGQSAAMKMPNSSEGFSMNPTAQPNSLADNEGGVFGQGAPSWKQMPNLNFEGADQ